MRRYCDEDKVREIVPQYRHMQMSRYHLGDQKDLDSYRGPIILGLASGNYLLAWNYRRCSHLEQRRIGQSR